MAKLEYTIEELYFKRNELLHVATSYHSEDPKQQAYVRSRAWQEALAISSELEIRHARLDNQPDTPLFFLRRDETGTTMHVLVGDDGITQVYRPLNKTKPEDILQAVVEVGVAEKYRRLLKQYQSDMDKSDAKAMAERDFISRVVDEYLA